MNKNNYKPWIILLTLALGFIMATLDVSISNVAVSTIQNSLNLNNSTGSWVIDSYMLSFASLLFMGGSLSNKYGSKRIYITGLTIFTVSSLFSGLSQSSTQLIISRFFQGAGSSLFMPASMSLLVSAFPNKKQQGIMFGIWSAIVSISSGIGPFIGGMLVEFLGWRSIFLINIPIGILGIILTIPIIKITTKMHESSLNIIQNFTGILMLSGLSYLLINGFSSKTTEWEVIFSIIIIILGASIFIWYEIFNKNAIIPKKVFKNKSFLISNTVGFLLNLSLFGGLFMFGLYLQQVLNISVVSSGAMLLPMMIVFIFGNIIFSKTTKKYGLKYPLLFGLTLALITSLAMTITIFYNSYIILAILYSIGNLGIGIAVPAMTTLTMQSVDKELSNISSTMLNVSRQLGSLVGVALLGISFYCLNDKIETTSISFAIMFISYLITFLFAVKLKN